jgi:uracil-DNA glycosylase family 4
MLKYVAGIGSITPKLMIIGEAPGKQEDEQGQPFVGPTGELVNQFLFKAGLSRSEVYLTNVVKYRPPLNDFDKLHLIGVSLEESTKELWENEIKAFRPNCILAVGDRALQAVTDYNGILNYRGSILTAKDGRTKVVATIHPAALFSKSSDDESDRSKGALPWTYYKLIEADFIRAAEESLTADINLPDRTLDIAHNSMELFRFFREYETLDKACIDIESINCVPVCIGFAFNRHHAISVPLLRHIGTNKLTDMGDNELDEVWRMVDKQLRRLKLVGHNLMYDEYKLSLIGLQCPNVYSDTLIKIRVIFPELPVKKLHVLASLFTREPYYKEEGKEFKLGKDRVDRLLLYNAKDCAVDFEVDEALENDLIAMQETYNVPLVDYYYKYQMKKHKFYLNMQNTGFAVDLLRKAELKTRYTAMEKEVHNRITDAVGFEVNVKSSPQKAKLFYEVMKFKRMKRNPTSEDTVVRLIGNHCKGNKLQYKSILEDVLEEARIRTQKSNYINFTPDYDGRCRSTFNIISTETTRSSTGIMKKPIRPKKIGLGFHTIAKHGRLAKDIRSMLICDPGMVMITIDASQAEPRVVAVLCEDWELLKAFDERVDIHRRTAGLIFGFSKGLELDPNYKNELIDTMTKDSPERYTGKTVRNAGNYDVKKGTFMETFNTNAQKYEINMTISEWRAGQMLEIFHAASPKIKNVFHRDIKNALDSSRVLIDPFGGPRIFNGKYDEDLYKEGYANIPQRTVSHVVQKAALHCYEEWGDSVVMWLSENHDSLTIQAPEKNWEPYAMLMKKQIETPIDFNQYCTLKRNYKLVIPGDVEISTTNYGAFEKVKL